MAIPVIHFIYTRYIKPGGGAPGVLLANCAGAVMRIIIYEHVKY